MNTTSTTTRFFTVAQAAERLGLSYSRILQFCKAGRLGRQYGRAWLIEDAQLRAFAKLKRKPGKPKKNSNGRLA